MEKILGFNNVYKVPECFKGMKKGLFILTFLVVGIFLIACDIGFVGASIEYGANTQEVVKYFDQGKQFYDTLGKLTTEEWNFKGPNYHTAFANIGSYTSDWHSRAAYSWAVIDMPANTTAIKFEYAGKGDAERPWGSGTNGYTTPNETNNQGIFSVFVSSINDRNWTSSGWVNITSFLAGTAGSIQISYYGVSGHNIATSVVTKLYKITSGELNGKYLLATKYMYYDTDGGAKDSVSSGIRNIELDTPGVPVVVAHTCSSPSQVIMKLYSENNSHGALWNATGANYEVCYNEIFGENYTGANPRVCSGSNKLLKLSSVENAHAEIPSETNYDTNICYGNLVCNVRDSSCEPIEETVLSLSGETNAHIALGDFAGYDTKICCSSSAIPVSGNLSWRSSQGQVIDHAGNGWQVFLWDEDDSLSDGQEVKFEIYQKHTGKDWIKNITATALNGKAIGNWTIIPGDLRNDTGDYDHFVFSVGTETSNEMSIDPIFQNTKPTARIVSIEDKGIYFVGEKINVVGECIDSESQAEYIWSITNGSGEIIDNTHTESEFNITFTDAGQKLITLECVDSQGLSDETRVGIVTIASPGIYVNIEKPRHLSQIWGKIINYSGIGSYVVDSKGFIGGEFVIECLGGACPTKTAGCPCPSNVNCPEGFNIETQCPVNVSDTARKRGDYSGMQFNWTFDSGSALGLEGQRVYANTGTNQIRLILKSNGIEERTMNEFFLLRQNGCSENGEYWWDSDANQSIDPTLIPDICNLASGGICCPIEGAYDCVRQIDGDKCVQGACNQFYEFEAETFAIEACDDYNYISGSLSDKESQCDNDCTGAWNNANQNDLIPLGTNQIIDEQSCEWISSQDKCGYSFRRINSSGGPLVPASIEYKCVTSVQSKGTCAFGKQEVTYNIQKINLATGANVTDTGGECGSGATITEIVPCGKPSIKLPVFTWFNVLIGGLIIVGVYFALRMMKKR